MPRRGVTAVLFALSLCSCGGGEKLPPPSSSTSSGSTGSSMGGAGGMPTGGGGAGGAGASSSSGGAAGSMTGGNGGSSGAAGSTSSSGGAGGATTSVNPLCGNGMIDPGETCDGAALGGLTCQSQGYSGGTLACTSACSLDTSACAGADLCTNGFDDDGDGLTDCEEADCKAFCADPCLSPVALADPSDASGSTAGHADVLHPSCAAAAGGGEVVYSFTAATTGVLDLTLIEKSGSLLSLSVRSSCASDATEVACTDKYAPGRGGTVKKISLLVNAGQSMFIVVDSDGAAAAGPYTVSAQSRPIVCGDGFQDPGEACDDGNLDSGDGCSATCAVE